ncbi:MAG: ABC transporter ATP-binding protein, partial [Planctomycetota bacterium]
MIEIQGLTKKYGALTAVDGLALTVHPGEWFLFCGPNGAGKTSTIRMLMGLVAPTAGTARVFGHEIGRESLEIRRIAGYLPEDFYAYGYLSGREYLDFIADVHGIPEDQKRKRIDALFALFAFEEESQRYV